VRVAESYDFTAPAEVVFSTLTDPHRLGRWLPEGVSLSAPDPHRLEVRVGGRRYDVSTAPEDMQLSWRSTDPPVRAQVEVRDAPAGGSTVHVEMTGSGPGMDADRVRGFVATAMRQLQEDVSDNFNAG
jgi:uncharacterized protein YndB with AHSA1/START domain